MNGENWLSAIGFRLSAIDQTAIGCRPEHLLAESRQPAADGRYIATGTPGVMVPSMVIDRT